MQATRGRRRTAWLSLGLLAAALLALGSGLALGLGRPPAGDGTPAALPAPRFVEEAIAAGLVHAYEGGFDYYVGGGVAVLDCDDDGLPDAYIAGGSAPAGLFRNQSAPGGTLRFERLADAASELTGVIGAYPLDIDGDGRLDLAVLRRGENVLLRGLGGCRFERANEDWGFDGGDAWTTAFSATWEAAAAWPTLAFGDYLDESSTNSERLCSDNRLYRPRTEGGYGAPITLSPGWCPLSMVFSEWDRSGRRDLRVSNDRHYYSDYSAGEEQLWRVRPAEKPRLYTADDGWQTVRIWGMGIASHDVDGDGYPDYYLTSQGDNKLQVLSEGAADAQPMRPDYRDIGLAMGVTAHKPFAGGESLPSTAWHTEFADVNNDGLMDLFVAKGNVEAQLGYATRDPNNLLIGQLDGTFAEGAEAAGIVHFARTRGAALADFNADGLLDLLEVNRVDNVTLWRNVGTGTADTPWMLGNWLAVDLRQAGANPQAVGAWVQVRLGERLIEREVVVGGGHAGGQAGPLHFGLGGAASAEVRVIWPDGTHGEWQGVEANQRLEVRR
ncbi:MAG TPA: CRTAC1 family protein [Candidatus Limnocylindria bacterium]|nr:CRTAC1 family protein [Candidatus Limnocylindria bacterium]